jgi:hypothetical protein
MELGNKGDQASWARYSTTGGPVVLASWARYSTTGGPSGPSGGRTWVASAWSSFRLGPRSLMALVIAVVVSCAGLTLLLRADGQYKAAVKQARYTPQPGIASAAGRHGSVDAFRLSPPPPHPTHRVKLQARQMVTSGMLGAGCWGRSTRQRTRSQLGSCAVLPLRRRIQGARALQPKS